MTREVIFHSSFWKAESTLQSVPLAVTLFLATVCFHIFYVRSSKLPSVTSLLLQYALNQVVWFSSVFFKRKLNKIFKDPQKAQEDLLKDIMESNADTKYGKKYKLRGVTQLQDLRANHPLTDYAHYERYVQQMANGEENVLMISEELHRFGITSGTTGKGKLIPFAKSRLAIGMGNTAILTATSGNRWGWASPLQKTMLFYVNPKPTKTTSGHIVGPNLLLTDDMKLATTSCTTPWEAFSISTEFEAVYITFLFGLRERTLSNVFGVFCSVTHKAMVLLEKNWEQLVHDIKTGIIDKDLQMSTEVLEVCQKVLTPEPERAEELRREFEKGFDGIMKRIWPHLIFIYGHNTADFTEKLENGYAKGIPIFSPMYSSTEGEYGLNLWPGEKSRYVLLPHSVIYEFIPEDQINDKNPTTLFIDEVQKGEAYEMVISTSCGFYRYRFGDVIKVLDFHHKTPVVDFLYRSGQLLNLRAEKVTEISVDEAVHHLVDNLPGAELIQWTSAESPLLTKIAASAQDEFEKGSQFYLIFVELEESTEHKILDEDKQQQFDDALKERNNYYKGFRNAGTISPPRVYLVKPGTFKELQDYIIANSTASYNQYKVPLKLKTPETLTLMLGNRHK
ncbi:uncharacterized protein [Amphiura filiformis]|uniref:uncharacterized protein isoform X2 n=1 Tax=Amphiura filiformis TaxID=82378 RepID=UPI003B21FA6E